MADKDLNHAPKDLAAVALAAILELEDRIKELENK